MPIKFFGPVVSDEGGLKDIEDKFYAFERNNVVSIDAVHLTSFTYPDDNTPN
jgi:hypothetical protein